MHQQLLESDLLSVHPGRLLWPLKIYKLFDRPWSLFLKTQSIKNTPMRREMVDMVFLLNRWKKWVVGAGKGDELLIILPRNVSELLCYGALLCPSRSIEQILICGSSPLKSWLMLFLLLDSLFLLLSWAKLSKLMWYFSFNESFVLQPLTPLPPSVTPTSTHLHLLPVLFILTYHLVLKYKQHSCNPGLVRYCHFGSYSRKHLTISSHQSSCILSLTANSFLILLPQRRKEENEGSRSSCIPLSSFPFYGSYFRPQINYQVGK